MNAKSRLLPMCAAWDDPMLKCRVCRKLKPAICFSGIKRFYVTCISCTPQPSDSSRAARNARVMARYVGRLRRTPKWLDVKHKQIIIDLYAFALRMTKVSGVAHEVDHIIPLQGKLVSGLHVPWNLRVITRTENRKKNNKLICL